MNQLNYCQLVHRYFKEMCEVRLSDYILELVCSVSRLYGFYDKQNIGKPIDLMGKIYDFMFLRCKGSNLMNCKNVFQA